MKIEIFINQGIHESRIAIVEDGTLAEIWVERPESDRMVGDIYLGKVNAVLPSLQAAFVDIGLARTAFLQVRDMVEADNDDEEGGSGRRNGRRPRQYPPIQDLVKKGQEILVQITKEPISTKGARITTQIALAGRFVVLMPTGDWVGVSRKISSWNERRRLRDVVRKLTPEGYSCIVRTEGRDQKEKGFRKDLKQLQRTHRRLSKKAKRAKAPALVHQELGMTSSVIRDVFTDDIDRLVVDSRELYNEIQDYLKSVSPDLRKRVSFHRDKKPIFDHFKLEKELEKVTDREVWMRRGGSLVIDHAEAGTFIDVNSARNTGKRDQEESILITNLEAAKEVARQLRLRDIGGIIVIVRPNLLHTHSEPCPTCSGTGRVLGPDTTITKIERWLRRAYAGNGDRRFRLQVHPEVAAYMRADKGGRLKDMRKATKARVDIEEDTAMPKQDYRFISVRRDLDVTAEFRS